MRLSRLVLMKSIKFYLHISISFMLIGICLSLSQWQWHKYNNSNINVNDDNKLFVLDAKNINFKREIFDLMYQYSNKQPGIRRFCILNIADKNIIVELGFAKNTDIVSAESTRSILNQYNKQLNSNKTISLIPIICPYRPFIDDIILEAYNDEYKILSVDTKKISIIMDLKLQDDCYKIIDTSAFSLEDYYAGNRKFTVKHLNYAIQWIVFALIAAAYGVWVWRYQ